MKTPSGLPVVTEATISSVMGGMSAPLLPQEQGELYKWLQDEGRRIKHKWSEGIANEVLVIASRVYEFLAQQEINDSKPEQEGGANEINP